MINEEAIYCMESYIDDDSYEHCTSCPYYGKHKIDENTYVCESSKAHRMAVKALSEQRTEQDVLDKIRAEIENDWQLKKYPSSPFACGLRRAIEIIDKYKVESEEV